MYCNDAVRMLRSFHPFEALDCAMVKLLVFSATYLTIEAGEALFSEGDVADSLYLIDEGEAEVWDAVDGWETKVATLRRNELIDCMAMPRRAQCCSTIRAAGPLSVLRIDADVLLRMVADNPKAALTMMHDYRGSHRNDGVR